MRFRFWSAALFPLPLLFVFAVTVPGVRTTTDVRYGTDRRQAFDVYAPADASHAPVIVMVHGGGWRIGDKSMHRMIDNKVNRWVPEGFVVISVNYRMLPDAKPLDQARDVARALATAQSKAESFGGDRTKFILMGHSAGAHLVALLAADPSLLSEAGATKPIGTVLLDSAALDVVKLMRLPHFRLYDDAFGSDPAYWRATSPFDRMTGATAPIFAVCSTRRLESCAQASSFVARAKSFGSEASLLREDLTHEQINETLGLPSAYSSAVDSFLLRVVKNRLGVQSDLHVAPDHHAAAIER